MTSLATLDQDGNVNSPSKIADRLMSYFFSSDYSQSRSLYGSIISLPKMLKDNPNDPVNLCEDISSGLTKLFSPYFDTVSFDVTYKNTDNVDGMGSQAKYDISVYAVLVKNGETHQLANLLAISNNQLSKVSEIGNYNAG